MWSPHSGKWEGSTVFSRYLGKEGDEFRLNGSVGDSDILRGDLSSQFLVPLGLEMLVDDLEGSKLCSCRGDMIEGEDPE